MSYLEDWNKLKDKFKSDNDEIAAKIKATKAQLKKLKKASTPDDDAIDQLESLLSTSVAVSKKPTGMSKVLPAYEKILERMEAMIAQGVPASDKARWLPLVKALQTAKKEMEKANATTQKVFGKVVTDSARGYSSVTKSKDESTKDLRKYLTGKNPPAKDLLVGLEKIQRRIQDRLKPVWSYVAGDIAKWG